MKAPFVFGRIASMANFTNREEELEQLSTNFKSLVSTILISPRRWGKSSLVLKAAEKAMNEDKDLIVCHLDIYNIRSEEEFYQMFAEELLKATSNKIEGLMQDAKAFLSNFIPKMSFGLDPTTEFSLGLDWKEVKKNPSDIINLAEKIAIEKGVKIIVCIDEFQNIAIFDQPLAFQKRLRSLWQKHQNVAYCLYGSKKNMLMEVFSSPKMPFYKFGDIIFLQKIKKEKLVSFIVQRFADTEKIIDENCAGIIVDLVACHPYYTQQLAQQVWFRTDKTCSEEIVYQAHEGLTLQMSLLFQTLTDELSNGQVNFLRAVLDGAAHFSSQENIVKYRLGTSANVVKIKHVLVSKEIIDQNKDVFSFIDPIYQYWLQKYYFKLIH